MQNMFRPAARSWMHPGVSCIRLSSMASIGRRLSHGIPGTSMRIRPANKPGAGAAVLSSASEDSKTEKQEQNAVLRLLPLPAIFTLLQSKLAAEVATHLSKVYAGGLMVGLVLLFSTAKAIAMPMISLFWGAQRFSFDKNDIDRTSEATDLLRLLESQNETSLLVTGRYGGGKTTLLKRALALRNGGFLYVPFYGADAGVENDPMLYFRMRLLAELGCASLETTIRSPMAFTNFLVSVAASYKTLSGRRLLIVVDGVSASEAILALSGLCEKLRSRRDVLKMVIVGSGGEVEFSRHAADRCIRIPDADLDELVEWIIRMNPELVSRKEEVVKLTRLVGPKFASLRSWAPRLLELSYDELEATYVDEIVTITILRSEMTRPENRGWATRVFERLVELGGSMPVEDLVSIVPGDKLSPISKANLFTVSERKMASLVSDIFLSHIKNKLVAKLLVV